MRHDSRQQVIQRAVRARVCTVCYQRPAGSETDSAETPRTCEPGCTIFQNLRALGQIARGEGQSSDERQLQNSICQACTATGTAGDFCTEHLARTCPLSRYLGDVLLIIRTLNESDTVAAARRKATARSK